MFSLLRTVLLTSTLVALLPLAGAAAELKRSEVLQIARSYAEFRWTGSSANVRHGPDRAGVLVSTPSASKPDEAEDGYWVVDQPSAGMPYKWGGFDNFNSFAAGLKAGKAAGDLYNAEKRRKADAAVSSEAVGLDCSGFISRCWKLEKKYGTSTLPSLCVALKSPAELKPGDIMDAAGGHVMLFAEWVDDGKDRARFYEANPYSKVRLSERSVSEMLNDGFKPYRYKWIRD